MSQGPFRWPTPDGYPDSTAAWLHPAGLLSRWNVLLWIAQGYVYGVTPNMTALLGSPKPTPAGALVDRLANAILFRAPTTAERDAGLAYLGTAASVVVNPFAYDLRARHLIALLASTPSFQTR